MNKIIRLIDRTRTVTDWKCPRARFWGYEYLGRGLSTKGTNLELFIGIVVHDALAAIGILTLNDKAIPIDEIAEAAFQQVKDNILGSSVGVLASEALEFANEQASLIEGMIRGFYKHVWPPLMDKYNIITVEEEMTYNLADGFLFMTKPDLIVEDKSSKELVYCEYKTTSSKKENWVNSWETAVQLHSSIKATEQSLGKLPAFVQIIGLYKGFECLVPETPVLTADLKWVPIGTLKIGDKLAGFEELSGNNRSGGKALREWREAEVLNTGRKMLPCYELVLEDGTTFTCSSNHLWLTAREGQGMGSAVWKRAEELNKTNTSRIVKIIEPWEGLGEFDPYDAGYLAAAFDGEGSLASMQFDFSGNVYYSVGLQFTQNPNYMLSYMKELLDKYHLKYGETGRGGERKTKDLQLYGKIRVLSFLGKIRPKRLLPKLDFNKLGMIKDLPVRPVKVISKRFVGEQEVVTLSTSTETFIANGFASHNSYGKQSSPFCYAYKRSGNPPFSKDQVEYSYKAGFKRFPTWEMPGGVKAWVDSMPTNILADQFPLTAPIFVNEDLVNSFFRQRLIREEEIKNFYGNEDLDRIFPQRFDQCTPYFGKPCQFKKICHGGVSDPLREGYELRTPHHELEMEQMGLAE